MVLDSVVVAVEPSPTNSNEHLNLQRRKFSLDSFSETDWPSELAMGCAEEEEPEDDMIVDVLIEERLWLPYRKQ
jgi:hypothetical protein